uniref:PSI domain-containing protein n=1 Tax=Pseudo-nitzschia australis TaxID=44445 RepID=A0A7S4AJE5_9STRA|mmetsp:Transcript_19168/g.41644  ORF Transcript_19168/g.41644 Transcript_19168/m.41644 type:complete len:160 (+) Transcript_19168:161-640(+)
MKNQFLALVLFVASTTFLVDHVESVDYNSDALKAAAENNPAFRRSLQNKDKPSFDFFDPDEDTCDNSANPTEDRPELAACDFSRFPTCGNNEDICYNRKPSRDHFHKDNHQHKFYIQYDRVFCYPTSWGGCSSCTPGRYCKSEKRCILAEVGYDCEQWF